MASEMRRSDSRGGSKPQRVKVRSPSSVRWLEVVPERVGGVEAVLAEGEGAGGGGGPGIHQRGLQNLKFIRAAPDEAAAILHVDVDVGAKVEPAAQTRDTSAA